MTAEAAPLLRVNNIEVIYEHVILVLKGVSLNVYEGQIVSPCSGPTAPARPRRSRPSPTWSRPSEAR